MDTFYSFVNHVCIQLLPVQTFILLQKEDLKTLTTSLIFLRPWTISGLRLLNFDTSMLRCQIFTTKRSFSNQTKI